MSKRVETENKREGLAPCPFYGCRDAVLVTCEIDGLPEADEDYFVRCNHCFAQGPNRLDEKRAIAEWNREPSVVKMRVNVLDLAKRITVHVSLDHLHQWRWRMKVACWLLDMAAWIGSFGSIEFVTEVKNEEVQTQA